MQEWIKLSEKFPDEFMDVLVKTDCKSCPRIKIP